MSSDLPLIIANPKAGGGISEQRWASAVSVVREHLGPFEIIFTTAPAEASKLAQEYALAGRRLLIAAGGDGTISEVANGILAAGNRDVHLGVLPLGTGSDFRRSLKLPQSLAEAALGIRRAKIRWLDAGKMSCANFNGDSTTRYFVNTASFGMSGRVATRANQSTKVFGGTLTYAMATLRTVLSYDYPEIYLQWNNEPEVRLRIVTVCVANGPSFGGGMKIAPDAQPDDGALDLITIGDIKTPRILLHSYRLYTGSFLNMEKVAAMRVQKVSARPVHPGDEIVLEVDGETPGRLPASFEIVPGALAVRV